MKCFLLPILIGLSSAQGQKADLLTYEADEAPVRGELVRPASWPKSLVRAFPDLQAATRLTHLVWDGPGRDRYLHWGLAGRYLGAAEGMLRYGGRPALNVTLNFVDTGAFPAEHAWHVGVEWLWNEGPFSVLAEANQAWGASAVMGDPFFWGAYVTLAWVLTGESRSYDRTVGYARRMMPKGKWGAPEIVVRLAHLDLNDANASGGVLDRGSSGLNWWATRRWKVGVDCGRTRLDRDRLTSTTDSVMARMRWIF